MRTAIAAFLMLGSLMGATVPRKMGEFGFELPNGRQALLSQYKGKTILLSFFSSTCPHCQTASKFIEKMSKEFGPSFQPIGVCFDPMAKLLMGEFIQKQGLTFPVGAATNEQVLEYVQHPSGMIPYVPMFVLIDKTGMIRAQYQPGINDDFFKNLDANLHAEVKKLVTGVSTPAPAKAPAKTSVVTTKPAVTAAKR
ncbi:MAG: TlpA family protein disulfide reductase [Bryobacteraceae bacterium]|nr:TlpA family protein disulfide reductase [Bryobacteraceae bacterium]